MKLARSIPKWIRAGSRMNKLWAKTMRRAERVMLATPRKAGNQAHVMRILDRTRKIEDHLLHNRATAALHVLTGAIGAGIGGGIVAGIRKWRSH